MTTRVDNSEPFEAAIGAALDALQPVPRREFCLRAGISERTFDRRANITKIHRGRRVFSTEQDLQREIDRHSRQRGVR